jgi:CheY-like chemotaxis protein
MRVLIVEDVPAEAELFADLVAHRGHDPIVAASAEAALESLDAGRPDAVLLDVVLPGMSGLDLLRIVREQRRGLPVVAMSGLATEEDARRCLALGAVEFLPKPLTVDRLEMVLDLLEARLLDRADAPGTRAASRRRYARAPVPLDVTLEDLKGGWWHARAVDVSPFGVKVRPASPTAPGSTMRLTFTPPDGEGRIVVLSLVVRQDPDGQAFAFVNLTGPDFERLKRLVDARAPDPGGDSTARLA